MGLEICTQMTNEEILRERVKGLFDLFPFLLASVSMSPERFVTNIQAERLLISAQMENGKLSCVL